MNPLDSTTQIPRKFLEMVRERGLTAALRLVFERRRSGSGSAPNALGSSRFAKWGGVRPFALLAIQNLVIFGSHYFRDFGFPWDFGQGYYALTAFWTTLWGQGHYPAWVPFYSMGLPFDLILQSGAHYFPLWIFPLLKIEYSLHAAVIVQCLHVLFGAAGMFLFLKGTLPQGQYASLYATFGAFIFQLFGGFYSNAEHVDIIRAFALTPWLFYFFSLNENKPFIGRSRLLFIPLIILLLVTGAYAGNIMSSVLVIGLYFLFQLIQLWRKGVEPRALLRLILLVGSFVLLGAGLSAFHLGPVLAYQNYLVRSGQIGNLEHFSLGLEYFPTLFLSNRMMPGEISMTSFYVTIPALILLTYLPLRWLKEKWPVTGVLFLSALMVAGPGSFVWFLLTRFVPLLLSSRFPSSDYRAFVVVGLIYFAMLAAKSLVEGEITSRSFLVRTCLASAWFAQGIYVSYPVLRSLDVYKAVSIFLGTLAILLILMFYAHKKPFLKLQYGPVFLILLLFPLTGADAVRVLTDLVYVNGQNTWRFPAFSTMYEQNHWPLLKDGHLLTNGIVLNLPDRRPARIEKTTYIDYSWEGYITGRYTLNSYPAPTELKSNLLIMDPPVYKRYMLREWLPLFFDQTESQDDGGNIQIPGKLIADGMSVSEGDQAAYVRQTHYGLDEIEYSVSLARPLLMVENETYFPGWTATLISEGRGSVIQAIPADGIFRAWNLPAGNYRMIARFNLPGTAWYRGVSIAALAVWLLLFLREGIRRTNVWQRIRPQVLS